MHRFFVPPAQICNDNLVILGSDVQHIKNVLKFKCKDNLEIYDSTGYNYVVEITHIGKQEVKLKILKKTLSKNETNIKITLCQGIPKLNKMELIVQKSVELGVERIIPVITERSIIRKFSEEKKQRLKKIAIESCTQSGGNILPVIENPVEFKDAIMECPNYELSLFFWEGASNFSGMRDILQKHKGANKIIVFIGPEGGFARREVDSAVNSGAIPVWLGPKILRTETAGIVVISNILYEFN
ncbi:MAG: 16S rRNA (uracil(1498)-N(3))-methyltransferase [Candidatus Firestonebacteria bacterium]